MAKFTLQFESKTQLRDLLVTCTGPELAKIEVAFNVLGVRASQAALDSLSLRLLDVADEACFARHDVEEAR